MGKIRALTIVSALALAPHVAAAADLPPQPMAMPEAPILRGTVAPEYSGWYLRGDVGVGSLQSRGWTIPPSDPGAGNTITESIRNTSLTDGAFVDFGVGYQVNNWFRTDITGEFRGAIAARGVYNGFVNSTANPCTTNSVAPANCTLYQNNFQGSVQASTFLINGYFDLGTWQGLTPYVGAGIGTSRIAMKGFTDNGLNVRGTAINASGLPNGASSVVAYNPISDKSRWNLAWALMAGVSYDVSRNLKLDIGYRYLNMGAGSTGTINCLCAQTFAGFNIPGLASHDFKIGMRWMLNDSAPAVMAAAAPMPMPAPAPMMAPAPIRSRY
jgi:opacity protein-like surface antigen